MNEYMKIAKEMAETGHRKGDGGPFGAVIVNEKGEIVAKGNNKVLVDHDATAHAEIVAIREASRKLGTSNLSNCILYTSCEPCPMCLSATIWANIKEVYYACTKKDAANIGFRDDAIYEYIKGNNKDLIKLHPMDREECISVFEEYHEQKKTIY